MQPYSMYTGSAKNNAFCVSCYYNKEYTDFTMAWHSHPRVEIMYVQYGKLTVEYFSNDEKHSVTLFNHDYIVIDMGVKHTILVHAEPTRILNLEIEFPSDRSPKMTVQTLMTLDTVFADFFRRKEPILKLSDFGNVAHLLTMLQETLDRDDKNDTFVDLTLSSLFIQIADDCERGKSADKNYIKYVRVALQYIHANYHAPISSADIAAQVGISQNYLNDLFKQTFDRTILEYLNGYRVKKAKALIEKGTLSFQVIAKQVGFNTKQNFNKNFLRYTGLTPKVYRESVRADDHTHWTPQSDESTTVFN